MKQDVDHVTTELPEIAAECPMVHADHEVFIPAPGWRQALERAVADDPAGKQGVAARLGVSRPYVSRVMTGHIPVASPKFVARVAEMLMQVPCPHLGKPLSPQACLRFAQRSYAQVSRWEVDHWRACRHCPSNRASAAASKAAPAHPEEPAA